MIQGRAISTMGGWEEVVLWSIEWYYFQRFWKTRNPDFKGTPLFGVKRLRNGTRSSHGYYRPPMWPIELCHRRWHWLIQITLGVLSLLRPIVHDTSKTAKITWFILVLHWAVDVIEVIYYIQVLSKLWMFLIFTPHKTRTFTVRLAVTTKYQGNGFAAEVLLGSDHQRVVPIAPIVRRVIAFPILGTWWDAITKVASQSVHLQASYGISNTFQQRPSANF